MNNKLYFGAGVLIGAAVGAISSAYFWKKKYMLAAQEEIDAVREFYKSRADENKPAVKKVQLAEGELVSIQKNSYGNYYKYGDYYKIAEAYGAGEENHISKKEVSDNKEHPYVISPEEFGEIEEYEKISLTYYADRVLTDDLNEPIDDIPGIVGEDFATHFGEYEDDSVFIRNDRLKCDYEILLSERTYDEILENIRPSAGAVYLSMML